MTKSSEASRWLSRPSGGDAAEDRLAALARAGAPTEGLGAAARDRVWARLSASERSARHERRALPLWRLRWSVVVGLLLTSGVVVGGVSVRRWWPAREVPRVERAAQTAAAPARAHGARRPVAAPAPTEEAAPSAALEAPASLAEALAAPGALSSSVRRGTARPELYDAVTAPQPASAPAPVEASAPAEVPPSALANETALLGVALTRLRQQRDAQGALAALDAYDARMPHGTLRREADAARVDALLVLGRDGDALALLQTLALQPRGRDQELRVVRAELTAPTSCARAVADFDAVLAGAQPPALAERALHGRATCLSRLGDAPGARRDLGEYLRRFPEGRFAAEARRTLAGDNL